VCFVGRHRDQQPARGFRVEGSGAGGSASSTQIVHGWRALEGSAVSKLFIQYTCEHARPSNTETARKSQKIQARHTLVGDPDPVPADRIWQAESGLVAICCYLGMLASLLVFRPTGSSSIRACCGLHNPLTAGLHPGLTPAAPLW